MPQIVFLLGFPIKPQRKELKHCSAVVCAQFWSIYSADSHCWRWRIQITNEFNVLRMTRWVKEQRSRTKSIHGLLHVRECMHKISRTWDFSFQLHFGHPIVLSIKFTFFLLFFHAHVAYFIIDDGCNCKTTIIVEGLIRETVQIWVLWTFISSCQSISSSTHFKQNPSHPLTARPVNTENKIKHISQLIIGLLSIF